MPIQWKYVSISGTAITRKIVRKFSPTGICCVHYLDQAAHRHPMRLAICANALAFIQRGDIQTTDLRHTRTGNIIRRGQVIYGTPKHRIGQHHPSPPPFLSP